MTHFQKCFRMKFQYIGGVLCPLNLICHTSYLSHTCEEFARIRPIFASVTNTYGQYCDFNRYEFFTDLMATGAKYTFVFVTCVTNSLHVTNMTIYVASVITALLN